MLQKYYPILEEINSPLAMMAALNVTANAAKIIVEGVSNETLEALAWEAVEETATYKTEVEASASELTAARAAASKVAKGLRYRAAQVARKARAVAKASRHVKAVKRPIASKTALKGLAGLSIESCRTKAAQTQAAVRTAADNFNTAVQAVDTAVNKGGDIRAIRSSVAALKAAVRTLEVRHVELRFAREMLSIALARHSA